jgi:hypothetical protein
MSRIKTDERTNEPSAWVRNALSTELRYRDGGPHWPRAIRQAEAILNRTKTARFLSKHAFTRPELREVAERLTFCTPRDRCLSAACPECCRALQRFFVLECQKLLKPQSTCVASVIDSTMSNRPTLSQVSLGGLVNRTRSILRRCGVTFAAGGVDLSFNEANNGQFDPHWCAHLWFLLPSAKRQEWESALRSSNPSGEVSPRPVRVQKWDGRDEALAYALKSDFHRRVTLYSNGQRNTSEQELRVAERMDLYPYLNSVGLHARVFLLGVRPTMTEHGVSFVQLKLGNQ